MDWLEGEGKGKRGGEGKGCVSPCMFESHTRQNIVLGFLNIRLTVTLTFDLLLVKKMYFCLYVEIDIFGKIF